MQTSIFRNHLVDVFLSIIHDFVFFHSLVDVFNERLSDRRGDGELFVPPYTSDTYMNDLKKLMEKESQGEVKDDEVEYYLRRFDKSGGGGINKDEIEGMLMSYHCYVQHKGEADTYFDKYDKSKTGALSRDELKAMMTELNDGLAVTEEEVDFVLNESDLAGDGQIERPEVVRAVTIWYAHVESEKKACCALQ